MYLLELLGHRYFFQGFSFPPPLLPSPPECHPLPQVSPIALARSRGQWKTKSNEDNKEGKADDDDDDDDDDDEEKDDEEEEEERAEETAAFLRSNSSKFVER